MGSLSEPGGHLTQVLPALLPDPASSSGGAPERRQCRLTPAPSPPAPLVVLALSLVGQPHGARTPRLFPRPRRRFLSRHLHICTQSEALPPLNRIGWEHTPTFCIGTTNSPSDATLLPVPGTQPPSRGIALSTTRIHHLTI